MPITIQVYTDDEIRDLLNAKKKQVGGTLTALADEADVQPNYATMAIKRPQNASKHLLSIIGLERKSFVVALNLVAKPKRKEGDKA